MKIKLRGTHHQIVIHRNTIKNIKCYRSRNKASNLFGPGMRMGRQLGKEELDHE